MATHKRNHKPKNVVFIGKKEIGARCLAQLLKRGIKPKFEIKGKPDIIFFIGNTKILPEDKMIAPCLNIHPGLLPKYRGRYSIPYVIFNGEEYFGVTLHWIDKGIDSGEIIMQEKIKIEEYDTAYSLWQKFNEVGERMFGEFLNMWLSCKPIVSYPQDEKEATYYHRHLPND